MLMVLCHYRSTHLSAAGHGIWGCLLDYLRSVDGLPEFLSPIVCEHPVRLTYIRVHTSILNKCYSSIHTYQVRVHVYSSIHALRGPV